MFDIWRKIDEEGAAAVPTQMESLSALGWVEVGEKYPELIPDAYRRHDVDRLDPKRQELFMEFGGQIHWKDAEKWNTEE